MFQLLLAVLILFSPFPVHAITSRLTVEAPATSGYSGSNGLVVNAKATQSSGSDPSVGERLQLLIRNPRAGDECTINGGNNFTDSTGYIYGKCLVADPGEMRVYVASLDTPTDESADTILTFAVEQPTQTPTPPPPPADPTSVPAPTATTATATSISNPTTKPTTTAQKQRSSGFGEGLQDEKDKVDDGLGDLNGQVLGTVKNTGAGDDDLLKTLIFLAGTLVLIIWSVYIILVQKGVLKQKKKKEAQIGIAPQPLD